MTCLSFSISKPFRKAIYTNYIYTGSCVFLFIFNALLIALPTTSKVSDYFNILPFRAEDGTSYENYKYVICLGIALNTVLTYAAEKIIVSKLTRKADEKQLEKKELIFNNRMQEMEKYQKSIVL